MTSVESSPSPEKGEVDLAVLESVYRARFDELVPNTTNEAGESEKVSGLEWTSDDGRETGYITYTSTYADVDDDGVLRTNRGDRMLNYKKTDPETGKVDQLIILEARDRNGALVATEFRGMPSSAELERAENEIGLDDLGVNPLTAHIIDECMVKDEVPVSEDDMKWAIDVMRKMKDGGFATELDD